MKKLAGIAVFFVLLYVTLLLADPGARSAQNHYRLAERIGLDGIVSLGAGLLIIAGGLDLSIGSVVGFCATILAMMLVDWHYPPFVAIPLVLVLGGVIGAVNGLLVTKLRVQPFVVTLCGLFIYRGAARWVAKESPKGLGNQFTELRHLLSGDLLGVPVPLLILLLIAGALAVFLHFSVYGRYIYALGSNERAARYSGIATDAYKVLAYVLCSGLAACYAVLLLMKNVQAQPSSTGQYLELKAIAGAVLGGCSLRGGEGTVPGMIIGASILTLLPMLANFWGIPPMLELVVIGGALLVGAILDEVIRPRAGGSRL